MLNFKNKNLTTNNLKFLYLIIKHLTKKTKIDLKKNMSNISIAQKMKKVSSQENIKAQYSLSNLNFLQKIRLKTEIISKLLSFTS